MDVALATCRVLPEPDTDEAPALAALRAAGLRAEALAWDDPEADFSAARVTVLRATWNYPEDPQRFLAWVERTAAVTEMWNPLAAVRWNLHKSYLLDLERAGVPVVPTWLVRRGEATELAEIVAARGWSEVVIKPAVSNASRLTIRCGPETAAEGESHLRGLAARGDVLVQPYVASVERYGERSLVWIDGEITHAVRKAPRLARGQEAVTGPLPIAPAEEEVARAALAVAGGPLLYARIDLAPGLDGTPQVMELELIEPSLFFPYSPAALARFVRATLRRLAVGPPS
jgi:glutathione synthase/RimK-type ligase-like ATP-grasp enzyme